MLAEIFKNELLIKAAHSLLINKRCHFVFTLVGSEKHTLQNELAEADEHPVALIAPLKTDG